MHRVHRNETIHLTGSLVELRSFSLSNLTDTYIGWLCDQHLMRYSNQRFSTHTPASCRAYLASFDNTDNLFLAIYYKGEFVGTMTAYRSTVHGTADIGILVSPSVQGQGLGLDAWSTLMNHLLMTGTRKVTGGTLRCNQAMVKIMQSSGMHPDGIRVGQELVDGLPQDVLHFSKFSTP